MLCSGMTANADRPSYRVIFDRLGLALSLGQDAQEAMADRMGDATDPMHSEPYAATVQPKPRSLKPAPGNNRG